MDRAAIERAEHAIARGHEHEDDGDLEAALVWYRSAVAAAPEYARAHLNVGNALRGLRDYTGALDAFRTALRHEPRFAHAYFNLGTLLAEMGQRDAAVSALESALSLQSDKQMVDKVLDAESYLLFSSAFREPRDPALAARDHFRVGSAIAQHAGPPFTSWANVPEPERKLRVGYVSADLRPHPVSLFLQVILERHDRGRFEIHCYSNNPAGNPVLATIPAHVDCLRDISLLEDGDAAALIRADRIDILVDLAGHTQNNRLGLFARHPAPVQVTWLGYLNTTGLAAMDYRICDRFTEPEGETESLHTERLYRMPHSQWCYRPWGYTPLVAQPHPESPGKIVFGSCNQSLKLSDACLDLWSQILLRLPAAELVILDIRDRHTQATISERLAQRGIHAKRVTLRKRSSVPDYYRAIGEFDVALDSYPQNGATTTLDTLWMGVPIVALKGQQGISRSTFSILSSLAMPELIAGSEPDYVELNVRLAEDKAWRTELRATLRDRLVASPLMNASEFAADLESGYRAMWRQWCADSQRNSSSG